MPAITVNIPDEIYEPLKRSAVSQRRSVDSEIIACLERAFGGPMPDTEATIARARRLRQKMSGAPLTDEEITHMKAERGPRLGAK